MSLTERAGAIQTRIVVLIGVLVVARKLMLQDFVTLDVQALLGLADCSWRSEDSIGFSLTRTAGVRSPRRKSNVRAPSQDHQQRQTERTTGRPNRQTRTGTQPQRGPLRKAS